MASDLLNMFPLLLSILKTFGDVLGTDDATKFELAISGSQLIWIHKAGHVPHFERPQSVAAHVLTFARRTGN